MEHGVYPGVRPSFAAACPPGRPEAAAVAAAAVVAAWWPHGRGGCCWAAGGRVHCVARASRAACPLRHPPAPSAIGGSVSVPGVDVVVVVVVAAVMVVVVGSCEVA